MLTADVRVEEFDTEDWLALAELLSSRRRTHAKPDPGGGLVVICEREKVAAAFSTRRGRLDGLDEMLVGPLADAVRYCRARWAVRLERTVIPRVADDFARAVARDDDSLAQAVKLVDVVRAFSDAGLVESYPRDLRQLLAKERLFRRLVDALCPVGKTLLLGVFQDGAVRTSIALHRAAGGFDRIVGPATARRDMGLVSGDFTRDARGLARAVELSVGPLALGCFAETHVLEELLATATPGAWATAVAARKLVFHPLAPALALPLGVDVGRAAVAFARELASRLGVGRFDPVALLAELFTRNQ
jgi:hypothetical protein